MKAFTWFLFAAAIILCGLTRYKDHQAAEISTLRVLIPPPPHIERFVFGHSQIVGDALWLRSIQDFDYCENAVNNTRCKEGWLYQMLDAVTTLAPDMRLAYALGAPALSVMVDDIEGATKLFEKGVKAMPNDWSISFHAAYHYLYEVRDNQRAAELLWNTARNGGPPWTYSLAARLFTQEGQRELGLRLIDELESKGAPEEMIAKMRQRVDTAPTPAFPQLDESQ